MENLQVSFNDFMEESQIFQRSGNKQLARPRRLFPSVAAQTLQLPVVPCSPFLMVYKREQDPSQFAPLWHEAPSWLADGFMFFRRLYGLQYYSNYSVYCAGTLW